MKRLVVVSLIIIVICSCGRQVQRRDNKGGDSVSISSFYMDEDEINSNAYRVYTHPDSTVTLVLNEFSVRISPVRIDGGQTHTLPYFQGDVVYYFTIELGESFEGAQVLIEKCKLENVAVEQCYQTSVSISAEGPHCDLLDWKHYTSPWQKLDEDLHLSYITRKYSDEESAQFPEVTEEEFLKAVKETCIPREFNLPDSISSPHKYPCRVGISHYKLRISGTDPKTGNQITRTLVFINPMGC